MKKQEFLSIVRKQIRFVFDRDKIENELKQHLADSIEELIEEGFSWEDAEHIAVEQMGNPKEVGQLLNKEHNPILGYLWTISRVALCILVVRIAISMGVIAFVLVTAIKPYEPKYSVESYLEDEDVDSLVDEVMEEGDELYLDDEEDLIEDEHDRYHDVNIKLKQIANAFNKSDAYKRIFSEKLIKEDLKSFVTSSNDYDNDKKFRGRSCWT